MLYRFYDIILFLDVCGKKLQASSSSQTFTSPNWPSNYPSYSNCSWEIVADNGARLELVIKSADLESPYDYIQVGHYLK